MGKHDQPGRPDGPLPTKRCPDCFTYIPITVNQCPSCDLKIGGIDKHGFAKKPIRWKDYFLSLLSIAILGLFIWWAFFEINNP